MLVTEVFNSFELEEVRDVQVLIIEEDQDYIDILAALLKKENFKLDYAKNAQDALTKINKNVFGLILLSATLNFNSEQGQLIDQIRQISLVPIIALVGMPDEEGGSTMVLNGADYDLQKPFTPRRLRAAITAVLRRSEVGGAESNDLVLPETLTSGGLSLSLGRLEAFVNNRRENLSAREFSLLQFLMTNPNRPFTREELAAQAWGWSKSGEMRAIDSAIKRLRSKIEDDSRNPRFIITERNMGYRFNSNPNDN